MATTVTAAPATNRTHEFLQTIVDDVAKRGGGEARLPAGVYDMFDALHLRSGVHIIADGEVVLRNMPSVSSVILDQLGYGHYEFRPAEPEKFRVGMGVLLFDKTTFNFCTTAATITHQRGDTFFINRPFARDYNADLAARVVNVHSLIEGAHVHDASATGLVLDGRCDEETHEINGCRGGGAFLLRCDRVRLDGLEVRKFRGDAISFQQCTDIRVTACNLHGNIGSGLHPGSGTVRYVMSGNHIHHNGRCGIFYCLRTTHSICDNNHIHDNGIIGISIGERDTDHLIRNNRIERNGGPAVAFRPPLHEPGNRVELRANMMSGNCRKTGYAEVMIPAGMRDILLDGNTIEPMTPGVRPVAVKTGCERIHAFANRVASRAQEHTDFIVPAEHADDAHDRWEHPRCGADVSTTGVADFVVTSTPTGFPAIGPAALPVDGALHLGVDRLPVWRD